MAVSPPRWAKWASGHEKGFVGFICYDSLRLAANRNHVTIMENHTLIYTELTTPLGEMILAANTTGVCLLAFSSQKARLDKAVMALERRLETKMTHGLNPHIKQAKKELHDYFCGRRHSFSVALSLQGSDFQQSVWQVLQTIPYGKTISYLQQSQQLGKPSAVRAVANANGANKISIIIPCHRVIGSNGQLTGYGGGLERKQWLLDFERENSRKNKRS